MRTYHILIPHDVEEGIEREIVVSSGETRQSPKDCSGYEYSVEMLLKTTKLLFHI
jgi:hypothetical protein